MDFEHVFRVKENPLVVFKLLEDASLAWKGATIRVHGGSMGFEAIRLLDLNPALMNAVIDANWVTSETFELHRIPHLIWLDLLRIGDKLTEVTAGVMAVQADILSYENQQGRWCTVGFSDDEYAALGALFREWIARIERLHGDKLERGTITNKPQATAGAQALARKPTPQDDTELKLSKLRRIRRESIKDGKVTITKQRACKKAGISIDTAKNHLRELFQNWIDPDYDTIGTK